MYWDEDIKQYIEINFHSSDECDVLVESERESENDNQHFDECMWCKRGWKLVSNNII